MNLSCALFSAAMLGLTLGCSQTQTGPDYYCSYKQELTSVNDAVKTGAIFLFGERHGTVEAPSFVADFACKIAQDTQEPFIVILELPIPEILSDLSIDSMPIEQARNLILNDGTYWYKGHDGRTSVAMMGAIQDILKLREKGLNVALGSTFPDENTLSKYDEMGLSFADEHTFKNRYFQEALQILKYKDRFKNVIVLTGNNHTSSHLRFFEKMGVDLPYMGFIQAYGGGSEWNCQVEGFENLGCKVHDATPHRKHLVDSSDDASLVLLHGENELFDGIFAFKEITASPPYLETVVSE